MRFSSRFRAAAAAIALLLFAGPAEPTSVVPTTFDNLIVRAENVVIARVVDKRSRWINTRDGRTIVTDVVFSIERTLKGPTYAQRALEFLGGTVGADTLRVTGMPEFQVGDRDVLFIRDSGQPVSPLVGFSHGRFRIVRDVRTGVEMVRTYDGQPLASLEEVGRQLTPAFASPVRALGLEEFVRAIDARVRGIRAR